MYSESFRVSAEGYLNGQCSPRDGAMFELEVLMVAAFTAGLTGLFGPGTPTSEYPTIIRNQAHVAEHGAEMMDAFLRATGRTTAEGLEAVREVMEGPELQARAKALRAVLMRFFPEPEPSNPASALAS